MQHWKLSGGGYRYHCVSGTIAVVGRTSILIRVDATFRPLLIGSRLQERGARPEPAPQ